MCGRITAAALEQELDFHETNLDVKTEEERKVVVVVEGGAADGQTDVERGRRKFESLWHEDGTLTSI